MTSSPSDSPDLLRRIVELQQTVESLREEQRRLSALLWDQRRVERVRPAYLGDFELLVYASDSAYPWMERRTAEYLQSDPRPEPLLAAGNDPLHPVMEHYWRCGLDWTYLDVGCHYGATAIGIAQFIRDAGRANRVVAFECGPARGLAPYNFRLNQLDDGITFEPLAVSDGASPVVVFYELAHAENSRIVNRSPSVEALSYPIEATSIDRYVREKGIGTNLIVKVDTQGAEPEVLEGMRDAMAQPFTTCIVELTPSALASRVDPLAFLGRLGERHHVLDLRCWRQNARRYPRVRAGQFTDLVAAVAASTDGWTDLMLLPKELPDCDGLLEKISA